MKTLQNNICQGTDQNSTFNNKNNNIIKEKTLVNNISIHNKNLNQRFPIERKKSNSVNKTQLINNDDIVKINNNNNQTESQIKQTNRVSNTPTRINSNEFSKDYFRSQIINQTRKSKFSNSIIKNGKKITNIDLNDDIMDEDDNQNSSPINLNIKNGEEISHSDQISQTQNQNFQSIKNEIKNEIVIPNQNELSQQPSLSKSQFTKKEPEQSILKKQDKLPENNNMSLNSEKSQRNSPTKNLNTNQEQGKTDNNRPSLYQLKNKVLSFNPEVNQESKSDNQIQKQNLPLSNGKSVNESNNLSHSQLMKKNSLKASRNKSPPKVIKTSDGKIKRSEVDNSGNSYYITINEEKIISDSYICSNLNSYLKSEISSSMTKESIPESKKKGNGFRYFAHLSKAGKNQNGEIKTNQDTPLVHLNVGGISGFNLFGVLDGHGPHGHFVSQFCRDYFIKKMTNYAEYCLKNRIIKAENIYNELKKNKFSFIIDIFNKADTEMAKQKNFEFNFSGTTCNIIFQFNKYLVCASVGDSRSILIADKGDNTNLENLEIIPLSTDHKPDLPGEIDRIHLNGGIVDKITNMYGEKVGPPRVWKVEANYPGLAMSRSLGDFQAKECGVIATPQIEEYIINRNSKYMVICSDGVWEFITNEQVRDLGNVFFNKNDVGGFCRELVKFAVHNWEQFDIIRDDITIICIYF